MAHLLVLSASGRIGRELVARCSKMSSVDLVRATCFSMGDEKVDLLKKCGASQVVKFDLKDKTTWETALDGIDVIYSASLDPLLEHHLEFSKWLGETKKASLKHIVRISCMGADTITASYDANTHSSRAGAAIPLMLQHYWWGEEALIKTGIPLTVLRCNFFHNHLLKTDLDNIEKEGLFSNPLGTTRNSFVVTRDIAECASVIIEQGPKLHANKFYDLTGVVPQNMFEIAADLSKAMKKEITYKPQSMTDFEKDFGATRAGFFEYLTNGFYTRCSPDFYNIVGKKPTAYLDYLLTKGACGETGLEELWQGNIWKKGQDAMKDAVKAGK